MWSNYAITKTKKAQNELDTTGKLQVLSRIKEKVPYSKISGEFNISIGTITNIKKRANEIEDAVEDHLPTSAKRTCIKKNKNYHINVLMVDFLYAARLKNIPVSGPMLQQKAKQIADALGIENFRASDGWLHSFRHRNNIKFKAERREASAAAIPTEAVLNESTWEQDLIDNYIANNFEIEEEASRPLPLKENDPSPSEADQSIDEPESIRIPKEKSEIRVYLDEIDFYLSVKLPSARKDFLQFLSVYREAVYGQIEQTTILDYFKKL
jgi:hypothetical protein